MANTLIKQDLDFKSIKKNLIEYLKTQDEFKDYEYLGSAMNILTDLLAYNTHYMGYYAHMLANESMIESILRKENMNSKAKFFNYLPKSKKASKALVTITVPNPSPNTSVKIDRGESFNAKRDNPTLSDIRTFILTDDLYIYYNAETGDYTSTEVLLYEGEFITQLFKSGPEKRYVINDNDIDTDTLKVVVKENENSTVSTTYTLADDFTNINGESQVYFLNLNENDQYEISFGNDVYGKSVNDYSYIEVTFVSTNGSLGNSVTAFSAPEGITSVNVIENSTDGTDAETLEDLRHNIKHHYRRQNRLVTVDDFKNIVLSEYKNINSVNVWGGEDNIPKAYGKVFVSIKPLFGEVLSNETNKQILNKLKKYTMATIEPVIVDPEYTYINLDVYVKNNTLLTSLRQGELKKLIIDEINYYNTEILNKFDSYYSDVKLNTRIMSLSTSFMSTYNKIVLEKRFIPNLLSSETYFIYFLNKIDETTVTSNNFYFRNKITKIADDGLGNVIAFFYDENKKEFIKYSNETFGTVDYEQGIVKISDIVFSKLIEDDIKVFANPINPLFFAKLNNIISIDNVQIFIEDYHGRESEKS